MTRLEAYPSLPLPPPVPQLPLVPLPPPFEEGAWTTPSAAAPAGRSTTRAVHGVLVLLAETLNRGIEEVGGARWREVLGRSHDAG